MIPFTNGHYTVIGKTRSGKTHAVKKSLDAVKSGVFFFNVQHEEMPRSFVQADGGDDLDQLIEALREGEKINFLPSTKKDIWNRQLEYIIDGLYDGSVHDLFFVADECHLADTKATDGLIQVATTGLRFGIRGIYLSQRMQNIDKTLVTQSTNYVVFETNLEQQYFRAKGIPIDEIEAKIQTMPKLRGPDGIMRPYAYCLFDGRTVTGPFRVK